MTRVIGIGILVPVVLLGAGCATKGWVRQELSQKEAEIGERIVKVEGQVATEARRIDGVDGRVTEEARRTETGQAQLDARLAEESQKLDAVGGQVRVLEPAVNEARGRADEAATRAGQVDQRLTRLWSSRNQLTVVDEIQVKFRFARADLDDAAETTLVSVVKKLQEEPKLTVQLVGFTDSTGPRDWNVLLSERRAEAVRRYLVQKGIELPRIQHIGLGALNGTGNRQDMAERRRVSVKLLMPVE
jgi:OOP family OmpA-OmpF porin